MSAANTGESVARALQATKLLVKVEKKFFKHNVKQSSQIREKLNRLRLKKRIIETKITMLKIIEEERLNSADALECEKCGLFQNLNESLHFCVAVENASTPKPTTGNKRHTNSLQEQSFSEDIDFQEQSFSEDIDFVAEKKEIHDEDITIIARLRYEDDGMVSCMDCGKTWDGFAQHRCLID